MINEMHSRMYQEICLTSSNCCELITDSSALFRGLYFWVHRFFAHFLYTITLIQMPELSGSNVVKDTWSMVNLFAEKELNEG